MRTRPLILVERVVEISDETTPIAGRVRVTVAVGGDRIDDDRQYGGQRSLGQVGLALFQQTDCTYGTSRIEPQSTSFSLHDSCQFVAEEDGLAADHLPAVHLGLIKGGLGIEDLSLISQIVLRRHPAVAIGHLGDLEQTPVVREGGPGQFRRMIDEFELPLEALRFGAQVDPQLRELLPGGN